MTKSGGTIPRSKFREGNLSPALPVIYAHSDKPTKTVVINSIPAEGGLCLGSRVLAATSSFSAFTLLIGSFDP